MVDYTDPSEFEDFAHSILLGHRMIYPTLDTRTESILIRWLTRMGMVDATNLVVTERGKIYGHDLETTYYEWFHSSGEGDSGELDKSFQIDNKESSVLRMSQIGSKPVIFLHDVPDPYSTNSDRLLLRLVFEFGVLACDEMEILIHCISDDDSFPNDFWLIKNGEDSVLGRGTGSLLKSLKRGQRFIYVFANLIHQATIVEGSRTQDGLSVRLTGYFSCSERVPYADSISQLRHKISPVLSVLGMSEKFEKAARDSTELNVNLGQKIGKGHNADSPYDSFQISPTGVLRGTLYKNSQKVIALIVTRPPFLSGNIPWLRGVSPWLVYCAGGTLDSDLLEGLGFQFQRLAILELENVVLAQVMLTPSS